MSSEKTIGKFVAMAHWDIDRNNDGTYSVKPVIPVLNGLMIVDNFGNLVTPNWAQHAYSVIGLLDIDYAHRARFSSLANRS